MPKPHGPRLRHTETPCQCESTRLPKPPFPVPNVAFRTDKNKALRRTSKAHVYTCQSFPAPPFATPKPHRNASRHGYRNQPFRCCCSCCWLLLLLLRLPANFCCSLLFLPLLLLLLFWCCCSCCYPTLLSHQIRPLVLAPGSFQTLPRLSTEPVKNRLRRKPFTTASKKLATATAAAAAAAAGCSGCCCCGCLPTSAAGCCSCFCCCCCCCCCFSCCCSYCYPTLLSRPIRPLVLAPSSFQKLPRLSTDGGGTSSTPLQLAQHLP